jgi:FlaG/FlaF family flagellin (archaellin)
MSRKSLTETDRGVSKVVGVVTLVAIVLLLATVFGAVLTGFTDQLEDPAPQIAFEFKYDDEVENSMDEYGVEPESTDPANVDEIVIINHRGGSSVNASNMYIYVTAEASDGSELEWQGTWAEVEQTDRIAAVGSSFYFFAWGGATFEGGEIQIIWRSEDSTDTVLAEWEG